MLCSILRDGLQPFITSVFPSGHLTGFNRTMILSILAKQTMIDLNINWWPTPASSPDLNPIEMVWAQLKRWLGRVHKPRTKQALEEGICKFWIDNMTPDLCTRYINHLQKVIPDVIAADGKTTSHWIYDFEFKIILTLWLNHISMHFVLCTLFSC